MKMINYRVLSHLYSVELLHNNTPNGEVSKALNPINL